MSKKIFWLLISAAIMALMIVAASPGQAAQTDPEVIDYGHYMAFSEDHIYYSTDGNSELKCTDLTGEVYGRVIQGGGFGDRERYLINCDGAPYPRSAMVTDGKTTFFITYVENVTAHALFSRPADGSVKPTQLTLDQHLAPRALVYDDGFVYFATLEGVGSQILRRDAVTGATNVVAGVGDLVGGSINGMTVDDTYIYWTEGEQGGVGRVRRALKAGGAPAVVADGLSLPWDIMTHGDRVYWTELEGERVARREKNGAGATESIYETDRPVTTLFLYQTTLYFGTGNIGARNGAIYRATENGGNPTLMAFGFAPPLDIARTGDWVYWVDGRLKRLRHDAETEPVDYAIGRWEVTQGVQDGSHTVPLAALKPIFVRVYANEVQGSAGDNVRAQLRGYINGVELPGSPLQPFANNNLDLQADLPLRADPDRTYIFSLPFDWTASEGVELQAEINPKHLVFESDYGNNLYPPAGPRKFPMTAPFICLVTLPVAATTPGGSTVIFDNDPAVYDPRMDRARTLLPVWLNVVKDSTVVWKEQGDGDPVPHTLPNDPGEGQLLAAIGETGELSDPPQGCSQAATRYGGIVAQTADFAPNFGGRASGNRFWARWWDSDSQFEYILPAGGFLWAHETGHTLGSPHVDCGGAGNPGFYPYPPCQSDDSEDEEAFWGYDPISGAAPNPVDNPDLMAYGSPRWVSDFTWKCIYDYVSDIWGLPLTGIAGCDDPLAQGQAAEQVRNVANAGEGTIVTGSALINDTGLELISLVAYDTIEQLTAAQLSHLRNMPNDGEWQVNLFNAQERLLATQYIEAGEEIHDSDGKQFNLANFALLGDSQPARIEIRETESGELLFEQTLSKNAPKLVFSSAFTNKSGDMVVDFEAQDPDGDPLKIIAQYIEPDGRKQVMFHTRGKGSDKFTCDPCTWPGRTLRGGAGLVRIFASDGLQTTMVERAVKVPDKAPEVSIVAAQHGLVDKDGFAVIGLRAEVYDAEGHPPKEIPVLTWTWGEKNRACETCIISPVGTISGEPLIFLSRENALGNDANTSIVEVQLEVTDSAGQKTTATVEVDLQPEKKAQKNVLFLPMVMTSN